MVRYQYQGTPTNPPAPTLAIVAGGVTAAKAGTWYFWLQYRNRAGFSQVSARVEGTIAIGQGFTLTIPAAARPTPNGADILEFVVLGGRSTDPLAACVLATYPGRSTGGAATSLPIAIALTQDEQLETYRNVPLEANLPTINRVNGMRRSVDALTQVLEWNQATNEWRPVYPVGFNTYVPSATGVNGSNCPLGSIDDAIVIYPSYGADDGEPSEPVGYWLVNDGNGVIRQGSHIYLGVELGDRDASSLTGVVGGLTLTFLGYANATTGALDTSDGAGGTMPLIGQPMPYQGKATSFVLPKDLPPNTAYCLQVQATMSAAELGGQGYQGAILRFAPAFYASIAHYNPLGHLFGSIITGEFDRRRIVPTPGLSAKALNGSGAIALPLGGGYSFHNVGESDVIGLTPATDNQTCILTINGTCLIAGFVPDAAAKRAEIGTIAGVGKPTAWAGSLALNNTRVLKVTVQYPTAIRSDYPDPIAGSTKGQFNATTVRIYVRAVGGTAVQMFESVVTPGTTSQEFIVGETAGVALGSGALPTRSSDRFGLYEPTDNSYTLGFMVVPSVFATGIYQVAIAFGYSNTVTSIQHNAPNCIYDAAESLADLFEAMDFWGEAVAAPADLRAIDYRVLKPGAVRTVRQYRGRERSFQWRSASTRSDDGTATALAVRPTNLPAGAAGRWEPIDNHAEVQYFGFLAAAPETGASETVIYADTAGKLMQRSPSNGEALPLGEGIRTIDTIVNLRAIANPKDWGFVFLIETLNLAYFNPTSFGVDDGATIFKPDHIIATDPGRWIAYVTASGGGATTLSWRGMTAQQWRSLTVQQWREVQA